jgi:hypothetical protein
MQANPVDDERSGKHHGGTPMTGAFTRIKVFMDVPP